MAYVKKIIRYPVKGFNGIELDETILAEGKGVEFDRAFALALNGTKFDEKNPRYLRKNHFLMLLKNKELAEFEVKSEDGQNITLCDLQGTEYLTADLLNEDDANDFAAFIYDYLNDDRIEMPKLVHAKDHMFSDIEEQYISIINLNSIRDFEQKSGFSIDFERFRGNIIIEDMEPWAEFELVGKYFALDHIEFEAMEKIGRCGATHVNVKTAQRDINVLKSLSEIYDHTNMGIYVNVKKGGLLKSGASLKSL